jgi:hypothetical protein
VGRAKLTLVYASTKRAFLSSPVRYLTHELHLEPNDGGTMRNVSRHTYDQTAQDICCNMIPQLSTCEPSAQSCFGDAQVRRIVVNKYQVHREHSWMNTTFGSIILRAFHFVVSGHRCGFSSRDMFQHLQMHGC